MIKTVSRAGKIFKTLIALAVIFAAAASFSRANFAAETSASGAGFDNEFYARGDFDREYLFWLDRAQKTGADSDLAATAALALQNFPRQNLSSPTVGSERLAQLTGDGARLAAQASREINKWTQAQAQYRAGGIIENWQFADNFGRFDRASFYQVFAPESLPLNGDFSAPLASPDAPDVQPRHWRKISRAAPFAPWQFSENPRAVIYLATQFQLAAAAEIQLDFITGAYAQIWCDARKIPLTPDPENADIFAYPTGGGAKIKMTAAAGTHRLLIKLFPAERGTNEFAAFLTGAKFVNEFPAAEIALADSQIREIAAVAPVFALTALPSLTPAQLEPLAWALGAVNRDDDAAAAWEEITRRLPQNAAAWSRYAEALRNATLLPLAKRESLARVADETALKIAPRHVPSLIAMAQYEIGKKRYRAAQILTERALAINPQSLAALRLAAQIPLTANWDEETGGQLEKLTAAFPQSFSANAAAAAFAEKRGDYRAFYDFMKSVKNSDAANISRYVQFARAGLLANRAAEAEIELAKDSPLGDLPMLADLRAQLLFSLGRYADAEKLWQAQPHLSAAAWAQIGKAQALQNRLGDAAESFAQSLRLAPDQHNLRRWLADLTGKTYQFWRATEIDAATAIKNFRAADSVGGRTARLIDQTVLDVYEDGSFVNYTHGLQAVLSEGGISAAAQVPFMGEPLLAETILPDRGISLEPTRLDGSEQFIMPNVAVGVMVHSRFLQTEFARPDKSLRFPQWYFRSPDSEEQFVLSQYIVRAPQNSAWLYATRNLTPDIEFTAFPADDGKMIYTWTAKDMPRSIHEAEGLSIDETLPFVKVGRRGSWEELNWQFANYYLGRALPNPPLRLAARKILAAASPLTKREKIERIFHAVCAEIEQTGWIAPASQIWEQRSGDRNLALLTLLKLAGLDAKLVAVRPAENLWFAPIWEMPDTDTFTNFMIAAKADDDNYVWLDARSRFARAGELIEDFAGGSAMIIDPQNGGELLVLPAGAPADWTTTETREYDCAAPRLAGARTLRGAAALNLQETLATASPQEKRNQIEKLLSESLPAIALESFALDGNGAAATVSYAAQLIGGVRAQVAGEQGVALGLPALALLPSEDFADRRSAYHLRRYVAENNEYRFKLPSGAAAVNLPSPLTIKNQFGGYQLTVRVSDGVATVNRRCYFAPQRISLEQWETFAAMARQIAEAENQWLWWR